MVNALRGSVAVAAHKPYRRKVTGDASQSQQLHKTSTSTPVQTNISDIDLAHPYVCIGNHNFVTE